MLMNVDMFDDIKDDDERQEAWVQYLGGRSESEARSLARSANDRVNSYRVSGPISGGYRPFVSDMKDEGWENLGSLTQDSRSDFERDVEWESVEWAEFQVAQLRKILTENQWEFFAHKYGLDGIEAAGSQKELAERLGLTYATVSKKQSDIRDRIKNKYPELFAL